jgi:hypothetical protein
MPLNAWICPADFGTPTGHRPPLALFCTDPSVAAEQIVSWYVDRWHIESTFEEVRAHLGLETQREWSTRAVARVTACLLGLFSLVGLLAHALYPEELPTRRAAWYPKAEPIFIDALAAVRRHLWASRNRPLLGSTPAPANSSVSLLDALVEAAVYPLTRPKGRAQSSGGFGKSMVSLGVSARLPAIAPDRAANRSSVSSSVWPATRH